MIFVILVGALMAGYSAAYVASEDVRYLTRAGLEETQILQARRPITELVNDSAIDPNLRAQLRLVLEARDFAATQGLDAKETYTTYADVGRDTLLLVLSASPRTCLCPYTWRYPIVGRIPYKGFFDVRMARASAGKLESKGYDVYLRTAGAFSTLGWFNDPLLSTAMGRDSVELAATVLHEIAHNTLYVKSATPFNESFAQLVGYQGAAEFFRQRGDEASAQRAADRWEDEIVLSRYYDDLADRLERLYESTTDSAAIDSGRVEVARWARAELEGPVAAQLKTYRVGKLAERPINNAQIIAARIYRAQLGLFERAYAANDSSVERTVATLKIQLQGITGDSAFAVLEARYP